MAERGRWKADPDTGELVQVQDDRGREILDPRPISLPIRTRKPLPLADQVARLVRSAEWNANLDPEAETFAEADDFDVDDDFDPKTPYEVEFDAVLGREITAAEFQDPARRDALREEYLVAERNAIRAEERQKAIDEAYRRRFRGPRAEPEGAGVPPAQAKKDGA